jgi:hypothetical protein
LALKVVGGRDDILSDVTMDVDENVDVGRRVNVLPTVRWYASDELVCAYAKGKDVTLPRYLPRAGSIWREVPKIPPDVVIAEECVVAEVMIEEGGLGEGARAEEGCECECGEAGDVVKDGQDCRVSR